MREDPATNELRHAHDVLAPVYVERLAGLLEQMPVERSVLELFARLVLEAGVGEEVADLGCGTGRLLPYLRGCGLTPRGLDLSPEMVRAAQRDYPGFDVQVGDLVALPYPDDSLSGVVGWYSLMYLPPELRVQAFAEIGRVLRPGGYLAMAYKQGDDAKRRGGGSLGLGIEFDIWWHSQDEVEQRLAEVGMEPVFWGGRPPLDFEPQPQGYLIARLPRA